LGKIGRLSGSGGSLPTTGSSGGAPSSRGGSSRGGSSGKSSRSSSLDGSHKARDGDISSRCSSGCWDTCTNSSGHSRPRTPLLSTPSPSGTMSLLMQPDPIRIGLMLPPSLLDEETVHASENCAEENTVHKLEETCADEVVQDVAEDVQDPVHVQDPVQQDVHEPCPGPISFKWDPYGRDVRRRSCDTKTEWSVEPLVKYLKRVAEQIDGNIETHRLPTAEKLDAFAARLIANTHRLLKHAPKKMRQTLLGMLSRRFQRFWNFARNEKVRSTNPEELKSMLTGLIEALVSEFSISPDAVQVQDCSWLLGYTDCKAASPELQEVQHHRHRNLAAVADPFRRG